LSQYLVELESQRSALIVCIAEMNDNDVFCNFMYWNAKAAGCGCAGRSARCGRPRCGRRGWHGRCV